MNKFEDQIKDIVSSFIKEVFGAAEESAEEYAGDMAKDLALYLRMAHNSDDEEAKRNLKHLKAQAQLLAAKHAIATSRASSEVLTQALAMAAQIGLSILKNMIA